MKIEIIHEYEYVQVLLDGETACHCEQYELAEQLAMLLQSLGHDVVETWKE